MIELLVNFSEFWSRLSRDIEAARRSVFVQTFAFEGDQVGQKLSRALLSTEAADKRILADSFTRVVLSDRFKYSPVALFDRSLRDESRQTSVMMSELKQAGVQIRFTNPYGFTPRKILSRNHKKLIVIDNEIAYLGGINFSEHNAAWHDMMVRLEGEAVVSFLREDFLATWNGQDRVTQETCDGVEIFTLDGRSNSRAFHRLLELIDQARESIFVESPYISFPFYEHLRRAAERLVKVEIVTPAQNNWRFFADYARRESARSEIDLRFFRGGMSHLKAMLIDDQFLIAGSSNFDYLSYRLHQELIAIFTSPELIANFRERVMIPDLANASSVDCSAAAASKQWLSLQTRLVDAALTILT